MKRLYVDIGSVFTVDQSVPFFISFKRLVTAGRRLNFCRLCTGSIVRRTAYAVTECDYGAVLYTATFTCCDLPHYRLRSYYLLFADHLVSTKEKI